MVESKMRLAESLCVCARARVRAFGQVKQAGFEKRPAVNVRNCSEKYDNILNVRVWAGGGRGVRQAAGG